MQVIREYWRLVLAGVLVLVAGIFIQITTSQTDGLNAQEQTLKETVVALKKEANQAPVTEEALEAEVVVIEQASAQSRDMGEEMIGIQKTLTAFYKRHEPLDPKEDLTPVRDAEKAYTRITNSTDYGNTWMLNDEWTMTLDSVANYAGTADVPVVFSMYTKDQKLAGLVRGTYTAESDLLSDVSIDYTVDGRLNAEDVGGK